MSRNYDLGGAFVGEMKNAANVNDKRIEKDGINITYPVLSGLGNKKIEKRVNSYISEKLFKYIKKVGYGRSDIKELKVTYGVPLNENGVLSIKLNIASLREDNAQKANILKSINCSLKSGRKYTLQNIINLEQNSLNIISNIIRQRIEEEKITLIKEFEGINRHTGFYLTKDSVIFYLNIGEYTPYENGIPEFQIPFEIVMDVLRCNKSPMNRLI